jgi:UDP-N-acetyl-D-glucosamine dehydrogenase
MSGGLAGSGVSVAEMTSSFSLHADLRRRIEAREARVAIVGLGYVGLPLALAVHEAGFPVTGFDIDRARVDRINEGRRVISYFPEDRVAKAVAAGFSASADPARLAEMDAVILCVPTPLDADRRPDLSLVVRAAEDLAGRLRPGQLVVLESSVWPGATREVVRPILERSGLATGHHLFLAFSPEREDPGNASYSTRTIPKLVGADDAASRELACLLYGAVVERVVPVGSTAVAEAAKLAENSFRTVNIALVNELKLAFQKMGIDVWEVIAAAATKPFGYMAFWPGPGIGGDCIPVSPVYLAHAARLAGAALPLVERATAENRAMPAHVAARVAEALGAPLAGKRVLMLGIAYKKDVEDTRESPALAALRALEAAGAACDFHDPCFPVLPMTRDDPDLAGRASVPLSEDGVAGYDAVLVATDHAGVDYALVARAARVLVDTRNVFARLGLVPAGRFLKG